jgi:hypothetical protein
MKTRILSIDPSGTGTTGIYYRNGEYEEFAQFISREWKEHLVWIVDQTQALKPDLVIYEHTNFINLRGKDMTSLIKLLGVIETLSLSCSVTKLRTETIPVDQVKRMRNKLLKGEQSIAELEYKPGKGWHHNQKKISVHGLDAYLVYWLWEQKSSLLSKDIANSKSKAKTKQIDIEEELFEDIDDFPGFPEDDEPTYCSEPEDIDDWPELPEDNITFCPGPEDIEFPEDIDQETDHDTKW